MAMGFTDIGTNEFTVTWTAHAGAVSSYTLEIRRASDMSLLHNIPLIGSGVRSYRIVSGVTQDTRYWVKLSSRNSAGAELNKEESPPYVTTNKNPTLPKPGSLTINASVTGTSIRIYGNAGSDTTTVVVSNATLGFQNIGVVSFGSYEAFFTGTPGTTYTFYAWGRNGNGEGDGPNSNLNVTVPLQLPDTPTGFYATSGEQNAISAYWNAVPGVAGYSIEVYRYPHESGESNLAWSNYSISSSSTAQHISGPGIINQNAYNVKLWSRNAAGNSIPTWDRNVKVGRTKPTPPWSWAITKGKGRSYTIVNNRFTNLVSHSEIVNFRNRINEFRAYKNTIPHNYPFSSISQGSVFTSTMYNQMETAITQMSPPTSTYGQRGAGSSVTVDELLNRLRDSLNSIP